MPGKVILGAQWGDEGKGKFIDIFAGKADLVVRSQGGNNAGHTVVAGGEKYKLQLIPSGILYPECVNVIGPGVVVNPKAVLGEIDGLPRILDCGQCNDAYSAIKIAFALSEAFDCTVNDLPLTLVLSWYEQKAVCILLTLLYLGIQNMYLGPTIPAFISENVLQVLQKNYNLTPTSEPEKDLNAILQMNH